MAELQPQDRILPCLLDRLTDDRPHVRTEPQEFRVFSVAQLRRAILRDLGWLLNARSKLAADDMAAYPQLPDSVLNYGLEDLCGRSFHTVDLRTLEQMIRDSVLAFEPRLIPETVEVAVQRRDPDQAQAAFGVEIRGTINAQPAPEPLVVQSTLDTETGKFILRG